MNIRIPNNLNEFKQQYYYKADLIKICRYLKLPASGTKAELNSYIQDYLNGIPTTQIKFERKEKKRPSLKYEEIKLDTKIVGSGFSFNNEARRWFADYFNVEKFSFKKEMAIIKREAERTNNTEMTLQDLICRMQHWKSDKLKAVAEEKTYQWNNFVYEFFKDSASQHYNDRLKVAAILWKFVRDSQDDKIYCHDLLKRYEKDIEMYRKS